ncbi:unnamed protein product, partial [Polarella glacialis]
MKGGTCSLRAHLQASAWEDNVSLPNEEVHFFDEEEDFARGPSYYASWFQWSEHWDPPDMIGDVTPSYLYVPSAIPRLKQLLPHARIVVLLRNPITRAVSHHNHDLDKGREVGTLLARFRGELGIREGSALSPLPQSRADAFRRGLYADQLQRLLSCFPASQLLVVVSERYRAEPRRELRRIRSFLGLGPGLESQEAPAEFHVRATPDGHGYVEQLQSTSPLRQTLREFYGRDVLRLRALLGDPIPEWSADFGAPLA